MNILAVIIAGGESRRLNGINKSFIVIDKKTIIQRQREVITKLFASTYTIAKAPLMPDIPNFVDDYQNIGPLGGIYTALKYILSDYIFVFSCDMPFLNENLILDMMKHIDNPRFDALVPKHTKGVEPLHAIYKKTILPIVENQIKNKNYKVSAFFDKINISYFDIETLGYDNNCFFNINYPDDILKANEYATRINL